MATMSMRDKKDSRSEILRISRTNAEVVDELIGEARRLVANQQEDEAGKLVVIIRKILDNNKRLQNIVGDVLSHAD